MSIETSAKIKQVPISEFKAHCSEELREIEENDTIIEITRHGKVIAVAKAPEPEPVVGSLLGAGIGTATIAPGADLTEPIFDHDEWEMNQEDDTE